MLAGNQNWSPVIPKLKCLGITFLHGSHIISSFFEHETCVSELTETYIICTLEGVVNFEQWRGEER